MSTREAQPTSPDTAFWNRAAEKYAARPVANPDAFERKIAITRTLIDARAATQAPVVLDIGCGTGSLVLRLAESGAQLHGLDVSSEMIRIANAKAARAGLDNVTFHVGPFDAGFAALGEHSVDGICAYSILHLLDDRRAALARILRLLAPGGFFVSSTVCLGRKRWLFAPLLKTMRLVGKAPRVQLFTAETLLDDIRAAGFVDLEQPEVGAESTIAFVVARKPAEAR